MRFIFDESAGQEIIARIDQLSESNKGQWGKMHLTQMLRHCIKWDHCIQGSGEYQNHKYHQAFIGKIFGKIVLKSMIKDDSPLKQNLSACIEHEASAEPGNLEQQKKTWMELITAYDHFSNEEFIHDFFGKMDKEQIGILAYKPADHHLRQFNA